MNEYLVGGIALASALVGQVMPFAVDFIRNKLNPERAWLKWLLTVISCILVGAIANLASNGFTAPYFDAVNLWTNASLLLTSSQFAWNTWYKNSEAREAVFPGMLKQD